MPSAVTAVRLGSTEGDDLVASLQRTGFVVLAGSAVSMWEPSDLPAGTAVTAAIARRLAGAHSLIEARIRSVAFEHIMEACPQRDVLGDNLTALYRAGNPNALHATLVALVARGLVPHIVTTNYDPCLETAARAMSGAHGLLQTVITEDEAAIADDAPPILFKIHGCAVRDAHRAAGAPRSLVYSLGREGLLEAWKRALLTRLVRGRTLLVCGYSGLDFEICPEIAGLAPAAVVWSCREDAAGAPDITDNARRVMRATNGTMLIGDMLELLPRLAGGPRITAHPTPAWVTLEDDLVRGLMAWDLDVWRTNLYSGIGCGDEIVAVSRSLLGRAGTDPVRRVDAFYGLGRGHFHRGHYKRAAECYVKAAAEADRAGDAERVKAMQLDAAEAERCAGYWQRGWRRLRAVETKLSMTDGWLREMIALRRSLILYQWFRVAYTLRLSARAGRLRETAKGLLSTVIEAAAHRGAWLELQHCELFAGRFGFRFADLYAGPLNPLRAREGYRQLGYVVAETMALRDDLVAGWRPGATERAPLEARLRELDALGAAAEMWKLAWLMRRRLGRRAVPRDLRWRAIKAWYQCEYTLGMRLLLILKP